LSALGFGSLLYGLSTIGQGGIGVPPWALIVAGVLILGAFVWRQLRLQRSGDPLLNLSTFSYARYVIPVGLSLLVFMALLGAGAVLLPIYLQSVLGHGTFVAGLALLPGGIAMAIVSRPSGRLFDRHGARPLVIPGACGMTVALWIFAVLGGDASLAAVIGADVLLMASLGMMMTPLLAEALGALPDDLYSHGSASLTTLQQVFGAVGSAVFVSIAALASTNYTGLPDARGLEVAFGVAGCVGVAAIGVSLLLQRPALPATA
jgi:DHA2 family lincomycin resistance protein-like MFS transporter